MDLHTLFNYFESIAIGLNRGLYDKSIVQDHLETIIKGYVDDYILSGVAGWKILEREGPDEYFYDGPLSKVAIEQRGRADPSEGNAGDADD